MLPSLGFSEWFVKDNEIFWKTSDEVRRVVCQGIATSVLVNLPGGLTDIAICFPIPSFARIYVRTFAGNKIGIGRKSYYFIGEFGDGSRFYPLPKRVKYRYGVELCPWMYDGYLKTDMQSIRSRIVNYVIENCCVGCSGIQFHFRDELEHEDRDKEWFKILWFDGGSEYDFFNKKHIEILDLLPVRQEDKLSWEPTGGWKQFKKITNFPAKTQ